jgi:ubiquinone/menaquinone biosynthesis C-methylase UbiE
MSQSPEAAFTFLKDMKRDANVGKPLRDTFWAELASSHKDLVMKEYKESPEQDMQRYFRVVKDAASYPRPELAPIDWDRELSRFEKLPWPDYYKLPFHSVPGGYLNREQPLNYRPTLGSIYIDVHPHSYLGMNDELAKLVPADAKVVVDLGAGLGDFAASVAKLNPQAKVTSLDASPFMIIVGEKLHAGVPNLEFKYALAEATGLPSGSVDCVTITLVFHECSDEGKEAIMKEAYRILRPGGTFVLNDTPPLDLMTYRGFLEPWKHQWAVFKPTQFLTKMGFVVIGEECVTDPPPRGHQVKKTEQAIFTRIAYKPASKM